MIVKNESWNKGTLIQRVSTDTATPEDISLRNAVQQALADLQTIQGAALTTEAAQISAIKLEAAILEKLIRFIAKRI